MPIESSISTTNLNPYIVSSLAALLVYVLLQHQRTRKASNLPPGPKRLPIIGNLLDIPSEKDWLTYRAWNEQYGDIVYIEALGRSIVVLGTAAATDELLHRRSQYSSDRPTTVMANELMHLGFALTLTQYGDTWRRSRKVAHTHYHQGVVPKYHSTYLGGAHRFAQDILNAKYTKDELPGLVRFNFAQMITEIVYGIYLKDPTDPYFGISQRAVDAFSESAIPGRFYVDLLPFLKYVPEWFPGAAFQRYATATRANLKRVRDYPVDIAQSMLANNTAPQSIIRTLLEDPSMTPEQLEMVKGLMATMYLAGSDTTIAVVVSFFLAMVVYPEVQVKAQAELDRVVGNDRLPGMADAPNLPYIQGVVSECYRWLTVAPMGVPHVTTRDEEYRGYFIPKGTLILGSIWNILHNPEDYPDPEVFKPERYLTPEGKFDSSVRDPRTAAFGFGRRICPGRHAADASLFATVSTILATVHIERAKDAEGKEIIPDVDQTSGILSQPKAFEWSAKPRSKRAEALLAAALS